jgi:4-hydroxy-2-oxoheptanedioate aldolase
MSHHRAEKYRVNPVTEKLRAGSPCVGTWLSLCSPAAAESLAGIGWDWLVVDVEHSPVGFETMVNCFRAVQLGGSVPMARVPWNDTVWIQRTLDAGAMGLVVPMVNSEDDARAVVADMKYATRGRRSYGGSRLASYVEGDYRAWADEQLSVIVMIETLQAVEQAERILAVEGVTGCFVGPADLALSMGLGLKDTGPGTRHEEAIQRTLAAAAKTGKAAGIHCFSADDLNGRIREGFGFLALASDAMLMMKAAQEGFDAIVGRGSQAGDRAPDRRLY